MRGSHRIRLITKNLEYDITVNRNITFIRGDSATGKTTFINLLRECLMGTKGYKLETKVDLNILDNINWRQQIKYINNSILFVDEGNDFVNDKEFIKEIIKGNSNYFVFINRPEIKQLPYSYKEIYEIKSSGKFHTLSPIYKIENNIEENYNKLLIEDSNMGYRLYKEAFNASYEIHTSEGNSNIYKYLENNLVIVFDGAAIGAEINRIMNVIRKYKLNIFIYSPESFEEDVLKSYFNYYDSYENIDSNEYCSYERYFTDILIKNTRNSEMEYKKNKINFWYVRNLQKFKNYIRDRLPKKHKSEKYNDMDIEWN